MHGSKLTEESTEAGPGKQLSLFDAVCIIVGIIVGVGVFETAPMVASAFSTAAGVMLVWLLGAILSLAGALCYAELSSAYPRQGGDLIYLSRAYGPSIGFLFGWSRFVIVQPGSIAAMSFPFARYFKTICHPFAGTRFESHGDVIIACSVIVVLTLLNCLHISTAKWSQNLLTTAKAGGVLVVLLASTAQPQTAYTVSPAAPVGSFSLSLILVLFCYGGWNEIAFVAGEVRDSRCNLLRALVLGTCLVSVIYLLLNAAFLYALGLEGVINSRAVAADVVARAYPGSARILASLLICVSTLGAVHGLIFTGGRISYAFGARYVGLRGLNRWNLRTGTPTFALLAQGVIALVITVLAGSFSETVVYTTSVVWFFFFATGAAVIVLRWKDPDVDRPYKTTLFPLTPIVFCLSCLFLLQGALAFDLKGSLVSIGICLLGLPLYLRSRRADETD